MVLRPRVTCWIFHPSNIVFCDSIIHVSSLSITNLADGPVTNIPAFKSKRSTFQLTKFIFFVSVPQLQWWELLAKQYWFDSCLDASTYVYILNIVWQYLHCNSPFITWCVSPWQLRKRWRGMEPSLICLPLGATYFQVACTLCPSICRSIHRLFTVSVTLLASTGSLCITAPAQMYD